MFCWRPVLECGPVADDVNISAYRFGFEVYLEVTKRLVVDGTKLMLNSASGITMPEEWAVEACCTLPSICYLVELVVTPVLDGVN